jgi:DNA processing protein
LLIKQGAKLVQAAEDILSELSLDLRHQLHSPTPDAAVDSPLADLANALGPSAPLALNILALLPVDATLHLDALLDALPESTPSEIIATLFQLQLLGMVREMPGKNYVKVWGEAA